MAKPPLPFTLRIKINSTWTHLKVRGAIFLWKRSSLHRSSMAQRYEISFVKIKIQVGGYADCLIWIFKCSVAFWWLLYHCFPYICNDAHLQPSPISYTANTTAINKMSFAGDRVLEVKWGRNISCDQLVGIFSTGLLKGAVEMWIFHSFLILAKEYFRVSDSVSERLSKKKKSLGMLSHVAA